VGADHSPRVVRIRAALASADLAGVQTEGQALCAAEPGNWEGYFWLGFVDIQHDNGYDAVRHLRRAQALDGNVYVLKLLGVAYYTAGQFHLFEQEMNAASRRQPDDFAPYYYLGRYYVSHLVGHWDKAAEYLEQAVERNPHHLLSQYYLGYCYEAERNQAAAERQYQKAMELAVTAGADTGSGPRTSDFGFLEPAGTAEANAALPYEGLARLRLLENKPTEALPLAKRAVALATKDAEAHTVLAKAYAAAGQDAAAIPEWQQAAALDPTDAAPYYHLYRIYLAAGDKEKADAAHAQFLKLSARY